MDDIFNIIAGRSARQDGRLAQPRMAIVVDVNAADSTVKVKLQPGNVLTGWIPCPAVAVGNGYGIICPPSPGDQVSVIPQEGDAESYLVSGRHFSLKAVPPVSAATQKPVQPGEFGVFTQGAFMHFTGGKVFITATEFHTEGSWFHKGDLDIKGKLTVSGIIKSAADVFAKAVSLLTHRHAGVKAGNDISGPPQQ